MSAVRPHVQISPRNAFLLVFALVFVSLACWSFADPLISAPDEQAHVIHAVALDHGQLGSPARTPGAPLSAPRSKVLVNVTVPASIVYTVIYPDCWHFLDNVPATCSKPWPSSEMPEVITTYVAHYPPLYYLVVGVASYVSQEPSGIYLMRLISGLLSALMLALCAYAIARWSRHSALYLGMYVALSPEAYFLSSSVNPGGFEISSAICLWTLVAIFALERRDDPPGGLVVALGVVSCVFVLIRGLSPLWLAVAGLTLVTLVGPRMLFEQLKRRRDLQITGGAVVVATLLASVWILTQGTLNILPVGAPVPKNASLGKVIRIVMGYVQGWIRECVGILGWLDTELPHIVYQSWYAIVLVALVVALVRGSWRERIVVAVLSALVVVVPVALVSRQAKTLGVTWQGRDVMPLAVGALIMAVAVGASHRASLRLPPSLHLDERRRRQITRVAAPVVIAIVAVANMLSFYTNMRRYAVGRYGAKFFFLHNQGWSPPTGQLVTLLVYCLVTAAFAGVLMAWVWFPRRPNELN
jgi:hypothetical protein